VSAGAVVPRPVFDYDVAQMTNVQQDLGSWNWLRRHGPTVRQFAALSAFLSARYQGLTFFSPNINIFRDPFARGLPAHPPRTRGAPDAEV